MESNRRKVDALSFDYDSHIESISRRFLERTIQYTINILMPAHDESLKLRKSLNRETSIKSLGKSGHPVD